jgi:hypothetical protein
VFTLPIKFDVTVVHRNSGEERRTVTSETATNLDAIAEVNVQMSACAAEYGLKAARIITKIHLATRRGA